MPSSEEEYCIFKFLNYFLWLSFISELIATYTLLAPVGRKHTVMNHHNTWSRITKEHCLAHNLQVD